jgi:hypothetical protein
VIHSGNHPCPKYEINNGDIEATGDHACFVVVRSSVVERKYSEVVGNVEVYKFVLMDGSGSLFKAVTNSCLARSLCKYNVKPGSSLVVYDYELIWMQGFHEHEFRFVMLINKCSWINGPIDSTDLGREVKSVPITLCLIAVDIVEKESIVVFTLPIDDHPERYVWGHRINKCCTLRQLADGGWIMEASTRNQWMAFISPLLTADEDAAANKDLSAICDVASWDMEPQSPVVDAKECKCVLDFGLCQCVCSTFPVDEMDVNDIYRSCASRLDALRSNTNIVDWNDLSASHKRWCVYWWYAVNIFGIRGGATPLPPCLLSAVRKMYPNAKGVLYTGFKTSAERLRVLAQRDNTNSPPRKCKRSKKSSET